MYLNILKHEDEDGVASTSIHYHDVIIIGGGLTGLRAALQISNSGIQWCIISKVHPLRSHSVAAQGGMNASLAMFQVMMVLLIAGKCMPMILLKDLITLLIRMLLSDVS